MKQLMRLGLWVVLWVVLVSAIDGDCGAQITREQVIDAIKSAELTKLTGEINAMDPNTKRNSISVLRRVIDEKVAAPVLVSGQDDESEACVLIESLPIVMDDNTLAAYLSPYAASSNEHVKRAAFDALSEGRGAAVGSILEEKAASSFSMLPDIPLRSLDESAARDAANQGIYFVLSLKGLLQSEVKEYREVGMKYFRLFQKRYSNTEEGRKGIEEVERELLKSGVVLGQGRSDIPASAELDQRTSFHENSSGETRGQLPLSSPNATKSLADKPRSWIWIIGIAALISIIAFAIKGKR